MARKLRIYFIGVGLGLILSWALLLRNRNVSEFLGWTPGRMVLTEIREDSNLIFPENFDCRLECLDLTSLDFENLTEDGDVNFKKSEPREFPKIYVVEYETVGREIQAVFEFRDEERKLREINIKGETDNCDCP